MSDRPVSHFMIAPARDVRRDLRRNAPWLASLFLAVLGLVLVSAALSCLAEPSWSYLHACYFTVVNMTTVGFGDVVPTTHLGKLIAGANSLLGLLLFGCTVAAITAALQPSAWVGTLTTPAAPKADRPETDPASTETLATEGARELVGSLSKLLSALPQREGEKQVRGHIHVLVRAHRVPDRAEIIVHVDAG